MSEKKKIVIKRRLLEPFPETTTTPPAEGEKPVEKMEGTGPQQEKPSQSVSKPLDLSIVDTAIEKFNELMSKINEIKNRDKTMQKVFHRQDFVDLRVVKKKLDELTNMKSEVLAGAGPVENLLNEAVAALESEMVRLEEQLFEKLVEIESLRDSEEKAVVDKSIIDKLEQEADVIRENISSVNRRISDLQSKIEQLKSLPQTINELTTSDEVAEPLLKDLISRFKDEARVNSAIEKIMQDESVPRQYAIIYLWKRLYKPRVS
jgi:DNA repair exonuclease SbcCD ATPase subunit